MPLVFNFKGPSSFSFGRTQNMERYLGQDFQKHSNYASFSSNQLRVVGLKAFVSQGREINFFPAAGVQPFLGNATDASAGLAVTPTARLQIEEKYLFSRLTNPAGGGLLFENQIVRTKANMQFTRALSFRAIIDYNSLAGNPALVDLQHSKQLNYDLLLTYYVHPGTALYVGYADRYDNLVLDPTDPLGFRRTEDLGHRTSRQLFVKLSYALRF
jgi:hypothetical protein